MQISIAMSLSRRNGFAPPAGYIFLTDADGAYLTDPDGFYLVERI
jgi:hypothetical protein